METKRQARKEMKNIQETISTDKITLQLYESGGDCDIHIRPAEEHSIIHSSTIQTLVKMGYVFYVSENTGLYLCVHRRMDVLE